MKRGVGHFGRAGLVRDRKSTRLNSSHMSISYAVFCLKKKKKKCRDDAAYICKSRRGNEEGRADIGAGQTERISANRQTCRPERSGVVSGYWRIGASNT